MLVACNQGLDYKHSSFLLFLWEVKICKASGSLFCHFVERKVCVTEANYQSHLMGLPCSVSESAWQRLWRPLELISCLVISFGAESPDLFCLCWQVKKHVRSFHSEKIYQCTECDKAFCRPDKLRLHMLRHSDRKDFLCSTCGKQFKVCEQEQPEVVLTATAVTSSQGSLRVCFITYFQRAGLEMHFMPHV